MDHVVGKDHQIELPHPMMGAEDFSYYAKEFPRRILLARHAQ